MTTVAQLKTELDELRAELAQVRDIRSAPSARMAAATAMLPSDVTLNDDGSITLNCQLRFLNPFDINTTGVGTITVLPDESLAAFLPLLGRGDTGLSPVLSNVVNINEIGPDAALPSNPASFAKIDPGDGITVPPTYQLTLTLRQGAKGDAGTPVNLEALGNVHLSGSATSLLAGQTVVYRTPDGAAAGWYVEATRTTDLAVCTSFSDASGNLPNQELGQLTFAKAAYDRRVWVGGAVQINPAPDTSQGVTHIDLLAKLGSADNGVVVGYAMGLNTNVPYIANIWPTAAAATAAAIMPAGSAATVHLVAVQSNPTLSSWSTTTTHASFTGLGLALV